MEDISSNISINVVSEVSIEVIYSQLYSSISLSDPLIYDNSNNLIGNSTGNFTTFSIIYTNETYYGNVKVVIPAFSILADSTKTNFTDIEVTLIKTLPTITYNLPSTVPVIKCKNGIDIAITFVNFPTGRVPLLITTSVNLIAASMSNNLFYHNGNLYFVSPKLYGTYNESIKIKPESEVSSLGQTISLEIENSPNVTQIPSNNIYTIISTSTNTTVTNMTLNKTSVHTHQLSVNMFKYSIESDDCDPTYELRNFLTLFVVNSEGLVSKLPGTPPGIYALDIVVRTIFGEELFTILTIEIYNVLDENYLVSLQNNFCNKNNNNGMSITLNFYCPDGESLIHIWAFSELNLINDIINIFLQVIDMIFYNTISVDFKTNTTTDVLSFGESLLYPSISQFENLIKSKFSSITPGSRLETKIDYFIEVSFPFFRKLLLTYINPPEQVSNIFSLHAEALKYKLEIIKK